MIEYKQYSCTMIDNRTGNQSQMRVLYAKDAELIDRVVDAQREFMALATKKHYGYIWEDPMTASAKAVVLREAIEALEKVWPKNDEVFMYGGGPNEQNKMPNYPKK